MREGLLSGGIAIGVAVAFINPFLGESLALTAGFLGAVSVISNTVPGVLMPVINSELVGFPRALFLSKIIHCSLFQNASIEILYARG